MPGKFGIATNPCIGYPIGQSGFLYFLSCLDHSHLTCLKVELIDGSYHDVDSSEMAFKIAGSMAVKSGVKKSAPVLLEPVMDVEVVTPSDYMGDIIGDLSSRRGKVGGMTDRGDAQIIGASVPLGEMFGYATTLRSLSQGRAVYTMQFAHYEEVPKSKAEEIINANGGGGR